ncbi:MAG: ATP-binding protein [bacterium]|nr:ATP-binding protein [bacterium]
MERFFNTAGPVKSEIHYCIDPLSRIDLKEILSLIGQEKYFVLHAPRQTGKTSFLRSLMTYLNKKGKYTCLHINVESAQAARENVKEGILSILDTLSEQALDALDDTFLEKNWRTILEKSGEHNALKNALKSWSKNNPKPIVLLMDEIDSLVGDTLISVLRQLRSGYEHRPAFFPQSIVLCGVRDVRDYRFQSGKQKEVITGGSAFNIKAKSLRMGLFNRREMETLYRQHTKETGQPFHKDTLRMAWDLTEGQPWLVNALAYEVCFEMKEGRDRKKEITREMILQAKENLILQRQTHLHQLADKLREDRVRRVLLPMLSGSREAAKIPDDDIGYVTDLGLIRDKPQLRMANRIYQEVIPRQLTYSAQLTINQEAAWYTKDDGSLDMNKLLTAFQAFYRKHFESWIDGFDYAEAGAQLLLQAFLQRIVNGGGRVEREYGLGRERTDLLVIWPTHNQQVQEVVLELKIRYGSLETTIKKGLKQTKGYMDKCGTSQGFLIIINRSPNTTWDEKIFNRKKTYEGATIGIYGM